MTGYERAQWEIALRRDNYQCVHCGAKDGLQRGHKIPQRRWALKAYGARLIHSAANFDVTCPACNAKSQIKANSIGDLERQLAIVRVAIEQGVAEDLYQDVLKNRDVFIRFGGRFSGPAE